MEKISSYSLSPHFRNRSQEEQDAYIDRLTRYGIPAFDTDGVPHKVTWRGDHNFSAEAAGYSLINFIEPEVKKNHPDWASGQVREDSLKKFEKRLKQDLYFEQKESAHEESSIVWKPIETKNGWELATTYGDGMITLSELWDHMREYAEFSNTPTAYNKEEHKAQLSMQDAFIRGEATGFVSVSGHPDSIRYVQVWQKTSDGSVMTKHVDLYKATGKDLTHEEGVALIQTLQMEYRGDTAKNSTHAHFFVRKPFGSEYDMRPAALIQRVEGRRERFLSPSFSRQELRKENVNQKVIRDTTDSFLVLGMYLKKHIEQTIIVFGERMKKHPDPEIQQGHKQHLERAGVAEILRKSRPKETYDRGPVKLDEPIKRALAEWWITWNMIRLREHVPVSATASLMWITYATNHRTLEFQKTSFLEPIYKDDGINISKETAGYYRKFFEHTVQRVLSYVNAVTVLISDEKQKHRGALSDRRSEHNPLVKRVVRWVQRIAVFAPGEKQITRFMRLFTRLKPFKIIHPLNAKHTENIIFESQIIERITRVFFFWWVIQRSKSEKRIHQTIKSQDVLEIETVTTEIFPWVLLSIIWYLAMLRESGKRIRSKKKKKKIRSILWHHIALHFVIE